MSEDGRSDETAHGSENEQDLKESVGAEAGQLTFQKFYDALEPLLVDSSEAYISLLGALEELLESEPAENDNDLLIHKVRVVAQSYGLRLTYADAQRSLIEERFLDWNPPDPAGYAAIDAFLRRLAQSFVLLSDINLPDDPNRLPILDRRAAQGFLKGVGHS